MERNMFGREKLQAGKGNTITWLLGRAGLSTICGESRRNTAHMDCLHYFQLLPALA